MKKAHQSVSFSCQTSSFPRRRESILITLFLNELPKIKMDSRLRENDEKIGYCAKCLRRLAETSSANGVGVVIVHLVLMLANLRGQFVGQGIHGGIHVGGGGVRM